MSNYPFFFTWSAQAQPKPFNIVGGQGIRLKLDDGSEWFDFGSLSYQANLGHGHKKVIDAVRASTDKVLLTVPDAVWDEKIALANKLLEHAPPGFSKVFFTLGGSEAVENALKFAKLFTGRHKTISRYRSYHGATLGALSVTGDYRRAPLEPAMAGAVHVLDCFESRLPGGEKILEGGASADTIARTLDLEGAKSVAAVILEPVPGANGCLVPPAGYWSEVRKACDAHGTLLIADCVLNGFGRLGTWYGFEDFLGDGESPDLITLSKGLTGGYAPLGAVLVHDRVAKHFEENFLYAGLTYYAHPIGVAAGLAAVSAFEEEDLIAHAKNLERLFAKKVAELQDAFPHQILRSRSKGLLGGLEFKKDSENFAKVAKAFANEKIYVHPNGRIQTILLSPPIVISEDELHEAFGKLEGALKSF